MAVEPHDYFGNLCGGFGGKQVCLFPGCDKDKSDPIHSKGKQMVENEKPQPRRRMHVRELENMRTTAVLPAEAVLSVLLDQEERIMMLNDRLLAAEHRLSDLERGPAVIGGGGGADGIF